MINEEKWIKAVAIKDELKKLEGKYLHDDESELITEIFIADKDKTIEDIRMLVYQIKHGSLNYHHFINTDSFNFWALINGSHLYRFSDDEIKKVETSITTKNFH